MIPRRAVRPLVMAVVLGLLVAVLASQEGQVSARVWFISTAVVLVGHSAVQLLEVSTPERARLVPAWWPLRRPAMSSAHRESIADLATLESITREAFDNPRVHALRLRPRLRSIAEHHLPMTHGIDARSHPDRLREVLGDVAWLIDPAVADRSPTPDDLERFLAVLEDRPDHQELADGR